MCLKVSKAAVGGEATDSNAKPVYVRKKEQQRYSNAIYTFYVYFGGLGFPHHQSEVLKLTAASLLVENTPGLVNILLQKPEKEQHRSLGMRDMRKKFEIDTFLYCHSIKRGQPKRFI